MCSLQKEYYLCFNSLQFCYRFFNMEEVSPLISVSEHFVFFNYVCVIVILTVSFLVYRGLVNVKVLSKQVDLFWFQNDW